MKLTHLGTTSGAGGCPELYLTDRDTYVVQGSNITDPEALTALQERACPNTKQRSKYRVHCCRSRRRTYK